MEFLNTKKGKIIAIATVIIVAALVWFFCFREKKVKKLASTPESKITDQPVTEQAADQHSEFGGPQPETSNQKPEMKLLTNEVKDFPLRKGKKGKQVEQLQRYLQFHYKVEFPDGISGEFDEYTEEQLKKHTQRDRIGKSFYLKRELYAINTLKYA